MNVEVSTTSGFRCYSGLFAKSPLSLSQDQFSRCRASWQELAGVVVFSAIPFTAVKAIANSPLGETLQRRMQEKKQVALQNASLYKALAENAKKDSFWYGEERPRWLGPIPFEYPTYLDGDLPGDYGFDIAGLSQDPVAFKRYYNFEILHARWAMLAALGALIPELLDLVGAFHFVEPVWWRVGYSKLQNIDGKEPYGVQPVVQGSLASRNHGNTITPNFTFIGRLLGPRGNSLKWVEGTTGWQMYRRGKGPIKDQEQKRS